MKMFIVVVALVATVAASPSAVRNAGWGAPPSLPSITVALDSALANIGAGSAGASLQLVEAASGDQNVPASIISSSGVFSEVGQEGDIDQVGLVNVPAGSAQTIQQTQNENLALAEEGVVADINGANSAVANVSGASDASGSGSLAQASSSINDVNSKKN